MVDMKDYYQTNKGRLLGIGGILIIVGLILYFARGQEVVLVLPVVGIVLFIAGVIYKPRKKKENLHQRRAIASNPRPRGYPSIAQTTVSISEETINSLWHNRIGRNQFVHSKRKTFSRMP